MNIRYILLDKSLPDIKAAHPGDAGFDLYARERMVLEPGVPVLIPTGVILEVPEGYAQLIWDKSGLATKNGLKTLGGVIDSGYRGETMVGMINLGNKEYVFEKGDKVAQMLIQKVEQVTFVQSEELTDTTRGASGFGSTGK